ncbi:Mctp2, partial [Symbiodinium sp. KB8]
FFARCTILPGLEPTGATCKEPQEGVSQRTSDRVVAVAHPVAQKSETVSRQVERVDGSGDVSGTAEIAFLDEAFNATFEQSFRFFIRNAKPTKVHIAFFSSTDLKPEEELRIGQQLPSKEPRGQDLEDANRRLKAPKVVVLKAQAWIDALNSVLLQHNLIMEFKDEDIADDLPSTFCPELGNWTGAACPRFSGQLQLWHINNMTPKKATQAALTKTVSGRQKREAERFAFQASQLRAQAEALERKARACHSEGGRLGRRPHAAESGLRVRIVSARGLRAADFNLMSWGTSDPFCTCEVVGQPGASFKTPVIDKCLDPCWDFEGKFPNYKVGSALKLTVYDQDWNYKNDFLGSATLLENPEGLESYIQVKVSNLAGEFPASADDLEPRLGV